MRHDITTGALMWREGERMQAKRGYVPKDDRYFSRKSLEILHEALEHIAYLINHGYGLKQATTFVGDHFQLAERQRIALSRAVATDDQLTCRRAKEVPVSQLSGKEVWIDGLNIVITLEVMLSDSTLLSCMDGAIRDLASLRGTYRIIPVTADAIRLLFDVLEDAGVQRVNILIDRPVSNSGRLRELLIDVGGEYQFDLDACVQDDVDRSLFGREYVISSDSLVLDHCASWVNLARHCMEQQGKRCLEL